MTIFLICLGCLVVVVTFFVVCACIVAGRADRQAEDSLDARTVVPDAMAKDLDAIVIDWWKNQPDDRSEVRHGGLGR